MGIEPPTGRIPRVLKNTLFWTLLLLMLGGFAAAQEPETEEQKAYHIEKTEGGFRFVQRLSWFPVESADRYEITIEKAEGGGYTQVLQESTPETFITCSLRPGNYRYQVKVYDLLGRSSDPQEWEYFEVLPALQPELFQFRPGVFYLDKDTDLTIIGRNLIKDSEIYLQSQTLPERRIIPKNYSPTESGERARLDFDRQTLIPDRYTIFIRNPGGLETVLEDFIIATGKPFAMTISALYAPFFPLYGSFFKEFFDTTIMPLSFAAELAIIPLEYSFGSLGFELSPSWLYWSFHEEGDSIYAQFAGIQGSVFFQKWFFHRTMALNFHLGGGLMFIYDVHFKYGPYQTKPLFTWIPLASLKISFQWFVLDPFFIELGLSFTHLFSADAAAPGYIRPTLGIGWSW